MFNINANLGGQRIGLSSLSQDMGLGRQRERDETAEADNGAERKPSPVGKEEQAVSQQLSERGDQLAQARLLAAEQRKAAESLLLEAQALEKKLLDESAHAQEARERSGELAALVVRAIAAEQEARERARIAVERHGQASNERRQVEAVLLASRRATEAATAEIAELKRRLEDVLKIATDASNLMHAQEQRAAEATAAVTAAEKDVADTNAQLAQRQAEREAAERDARNAKERAAAAEKSAQAIAQPVAASSPQASTNGKQRAGAGAA